MVPGPSCVAWCGAGPRRGRGRAGVRGWQEGRDLVGAPVAGRAGAPGEVVGDGPCVPGAGLQQARRQVRHVGGCRADPVHRVHVPGSGEGQHRDAVQGAGADQGLVPARSQLVASRAQDLGEVDVRPGLPVHLLGGDVGELLDGHQVGPRAQAARRRRVVEGAAARPHDGLRGEVQAAGQFDGHRAGRRAGVAAAGIAAGGARGGASGQVRRGASGEVAGQPPRCMFEP